MRYIYEFLNLVTLTVRNIIDTENIRAGIFIDTFWFESYRSSFWWTV